MNLNSKVERGREKRVGSESCQSVDLHEICPSEGILTSA